MSLAAIVDLDRYPIDRPRARASLAAEHARRFARDGVAALPGFVLPQAVERMVQECEGINGDGHHSEVAGTVYLGLPQDDLDPSDPRAHPVRSSLRAVAADCIPPSHALRQLYESEDLREFIRLVLGVEELHHYADPLGALNVADMTAGDELGWHFDQTDFVTSLSIRRAGSGGHFEAVTNVRSRHDERFDDVRAVLDDRSDRVVRLPFDPGTLLVFAGRWSLHRVTPIDAPPSRLVGLLAYDVEPGVDSTELLKLVRYGRATPRDVPWVTAVGGAAT